MVEGAVPGFWDLRGRYTPSSVSPFHLWTFPPSPVSSSFGDQGVLTSSRMHDLRRSRSSLVREEWPWSLSARERKRLGGKGSRA